MKIRWASNRIAIAIVTLYLFTSCGIIRSVWFFRPDTDDYRHDPYKFIAAPEAPFQFSTSDQSEETGTQIFVTCCFGPNTITLNEFMKQYGTEAFLIIRNDTILYESYPDNHKESRPVTSFSISKAIMTTLTGIALREGYLQSLDQPVGEILSDWNGPEFRNITVGDLLQHTSGLSFSRSIINPTSDQVQFYYGKNLHHRMTQRKPETAPGQRFDYHSANTQLLAMVLEKASGQSIPEYLESELWKPLGMEAPAFWSVDRKDGKGMVRSFCCLQACARDFARIGRLWLHQGKWQGHQLLPPDWLSQILATARTDSGRFRCGFSVLNSDCDASFYATGLLGQFIYVVPEKNLLILRFGQHRKNYSSQIWRDHFAEIARQL